MIELRVLTNGDKVYGADEVDAVLKAKDALIKAFKDASEQTLYYDIPTEHYELLDELVKRAEGEVGEWPNKSITNTSMTW